MALFAITFSGGNDIVLFLLTLGLKAQKHLARGRASASPRVNVPNNFRPAGRKRYFSTAAECDFSKLSNKICTVKVKIHIFVNWKPTKIKEMKEQKEKNIRISTFY